MKKASSSQLVDELHTTSAEERKMLLEQAGIKPEVPFGQGLAMKSELSIPWNKELSTHAIHINPFTGGFLQAHMNSYMEFQALMLSVGFFCFLATYSGEPERAPNLATWLRVFCPSVCIIIIHIIHKAHHQGGPKQPCWPTSEV